jgi:hypothetical protein
MGKKYGANWTKNEHAVIDYLNYTTKFENSNSALTQNLTRNQTQSYLSIWTRQYNYLKVKKKINPTTSLNLN